MAKTNSITMPNVKQLNLNGVCRLAKKCSEIIKSRKMGIIEGAAIATSLSMASGGSFNLKLREIRNLVKVFNKSNADKDAIKRFLILTAMLYADIMKQIVVDGNKKIYKKPRAWSPFEISVGQKRDIESEIILKGDLCNGYLAVNKVVGKRASGFGLGFEINVIEETKIIDIAAITKIQIKKVSAFHRLCLIPKTQEKKEMIFK